MPKMPRGMACQTHTKLGKINQTTKRDRNKNQPHFQCRRHHLTNLLFFRRQSHTPSLPVKLLNKETKQKSKKKKKK